MNREVHVQFCEGVGLRCPALLTFVEGRITNREYEARDGSGKRHRTEVVAQRVQFLGGRPAAGADDNLQDFNSGPDIPPAVDDEDIPFIVAFDMPPDRRFRM
jgi:Single-strand binding protein family